MVNGTNSTRDKWWGGGGGGSLVWGTNRLQRKWSGRKWHWGQGVTGPAMHISRPSEGGIMSLL